MREVIVKKVIVFLVIFILGVVDFSFPEELRTVIRVVDGDTVIVDGKEKVRLIGVDTPETVHPSKSVEYFGKEATAFTKKMCEGKKVRLEYDWQR